MGEWDEEEWVDEEMEEENSCDYGVCEFCSDPQTREMGVCTTECTEYLETLEGSDEKALTRRKPE